MRYVLWKKARTHCACEAIATTQLSTTAGATAVSFGSPSSAFEISGATLVKKSRSFGFNCSILLSSQSTIVLAALFLTDGDILINSTKSKVPKRWAVVIYGNVQTARL